MPISGNTTVAAVLGSPVRHSLSPAIHNAAFEAAGLDWVFVALEVREADLDAALSGIRTQLGWGGLSVTMPLKQAAAGLVDSLSPDAASLGAVSAIEISQGRLIGHNYDGAGLCASLREEAAWIPRGRRVAVLGAGGAARAVVRAMVDGGADDVAIVARRGGAARAVAEAVGGRPGGTADIGLADTVINATSAGMADTSGAGTTPVDVTLLRSDHVVVDIVYHPAETPLLEAARRIGARSVGGLGMLVHQAGLAFETWSGGPAPIEVMRAAALAALGHR